MLGQITQTDVDLWDTTRRGAKRWALDWYDTIQSGDTVEIHVGIVQPAGPMNADRDFEGGVLLGDGNEGRHIDKPGGPHASDARLVRGLLRRLRLAMPD